MELRDIIIQGRQQLGLSQKQLAEKCGLHQSLIARCEAGTNEPKFSTGIAILNALNYDFTKLSTNMNETPEEKNNRWNKLISPLFNVSHKYVDESVIFLLTANEDIRLQNIDIEAGYTIPLYEDDLDLIYANTDEDLEEKKNNDFQSYLFDVLKMRLNEKLLIDYYRTNNIVISDPSHIPEELIMILKGKKRIPSSAITKHL